MKTLVVFLAAFLAVNALSFSQQWREFKTKHGKSYKNIVEEKLRSAVFLSNLKRIEAHNAKYNNGEVSYYLGINKFADRTPQEFEKMLFHQIQTKPDIQGTFHDFSNVKAPSSVDWRLQNAVLGVKDQGNCGSCWSFSTTGSLEGQNFLVNNISIPLSEQELMDCSWAFGNNGCNGGNMETSFQYVRQHGISSEQSYPYEAENNGCRRNASNIILKIKDYNLVPTDSEDALINAIASIGPISVAVYADAALQLYAGGIFDEPACTNYLLNHGVLAIGYDSEDGKDFWIVKNSWGEEWGESGYYRLQRNPSICGILKDGSYPIIN